MIQTSLKKAPDISSATEVVVRPLTGNDFQSYRALRQKILHIGEGKFFSSSYTKEDSFKNDDDWRDWCTEKREHCIHGLFIENELVGVMGILEHGEPRGSAVEWEATWIEPALRRLGIAKEGYKSVWEWTVQHGYPLACVYIRADNERSIQIRKSQGAVYQYTLHDQKWADGSTCDAHYFEIDLKAAAGKSYNEAIQHLQNTLQELDEEPNITISKTAKTA